jgi:hypothetical protein
MEASRRTFETGGERLHKRGSQIDPSEPPDLRARTFDSPPWLTYPFLNTGG